MNRYYNQKNLYILGNRYAEGRIVKKNSRIAAEYYKKSLFSKKYLGLKELHEMYRNGIGVSRN